MIRDYQKTKCIKLYKEGLLTIKGIMAETGIQSEQTVYRILDEVGIPRRPMKDVMRKSIAFDKETVAIITKAHPRKLSPWICETIKSAYRNGLVSTDE